jgi:heterodisulfide reductase subunit C
VKPHELVRLVQLDQRRAVLASRGIWECTSCQTCVTRCPQKVDIAAMNDALRAMSVAAGLAPRDSAVPVFHSVFLNNVRKRGRVHEMELMAELKLRALASAALSFPLTGGRQKWMEALRSGAKELLADADKAPMMIVKGKLSLHGARVRGKAKRKAIFRRAAGGKP